MDQAINEFKKYANNYLDYGTMITLKINHTLRVLDLCNYLSEAKKLNEEDTHIVSIIGLLHDIGRFEQWKNYHTFKDLDSIDHADFGVELLKKNHFLRKFIKEDQYDSIILNSIQNHNKYKIPNKIDKKERLFSKIIRDADKIDILYLYVIKEIDLELDENAFTNSTYKKLLKHKTINRKDIKTKTDRLSVSLGFIYDIYFKESLQMIKDNKYIDSIIEIYKGKTKNQELIKQLDTIKKEINHYIEVKLC